MKRFSGLLFAALLAFAPAIATAAVTTTGAGKVPSGGGGGYVGPGDIKSGAKSFYGLRGYNAALSATGTLKAASLTRTLDAHTCDLLIATNGDIGLTTSCSTGGDNGSTFAAWCNATTCTVLAYDQITTTAANTIGTGFGVGFNCLNTTRPCLTLDGSTQGVEAPSSTATSVPFTISAVAIRTGNLGAQNDIVVSTNGVYFEPSAAKAAGYFGIQVDGAAADSAWHAMQFVVSSGGSPGVNVDGTFSAGSMGTGNLDADYYIGRQSGGSYLAGKIAEVGIWPSAFTPTEQANMCHNQFAYWGTSTSC